MKSEVVLVCFHSQQGIKETSFPASVLQLQSYNLFRQIAPNNNFPHASSFLDICLLRWAKPRPLHHMQSIWTRRCTQSCQYSATSAAIIPSLSDHICSQRRRSHEELMMSWPKLTPGAENKTLVTEDLKVGIWGKQQGASPEWVTLIISRHLNWRDTWDLKWLIKDKVKAGPAFWACVSISSLVLYEFQVLWRSSVLVKSDWRSYLSGWPAELLAIPEI